MDRADVEGLYQDFVGSFPMGHTRVSAEDPCVYALKAWIIAADITQGPLFRAISRSNRVLDRRLTPRAYANIVKQAARQAGLDASQVSTHSLRLGYASNTPKGLEE